MILTVALVLILTILDLELRLPVGVRGMVGRRG
jgi:hypothetical protein